MRDSKVDFFRGLSIILIILIHVLAKYLYFAFSYNIWNFLHFVEILLIFCSGASLAYSHPKFRDAKEIFGFIKKRISRIVIPWWIFTFIFLAVLFTFDFISRQPFRYGAEYILRTLFLFGIGGGNAYGWILAVILGLSVLYPFIVLFVKRYGYLTMLFSAILMMALFEIFGRYTGKWPFFIYLNYLVPFALGIYYASGKKLLKPLVLFAMLVMLSIFMVIKVGETTELTNHKWPPDLFFVSYSLSMTLLIFFIAGKKNLSGRITDFFSVNSLWIYQWHILVLGISFQVFGKIALFNNEPYAYLKFLFVLGMSSAIVLVQNKLTIYVKSYLSAR